MPRYAMRIEYDGTPFAGWQRQPGGVATVQGTLEAAILAFTGEQVTVSGAGRTDAGVHARGQVAHVTLAKDWDPFRIAAAANFHAKPNPVAVIACGRVEEDFDARFSATRRVYEYKLFPRRAAPVLDRDRVWWVIPPIDVTAMRDAAQVFVGHHDFTTFRAAQCQAKSPFKTLDHFDVTESGQYVTCRVVARSFLHNQVRSMVGSLKLVGDGTWTKAALVGALAARDRAACGPVAPACGLYLHSVEYAGRRDWT